MVNHPKKVRVALIGLGKLGILHTAVVNMIPDAELCALVDVNKQLSRYAEQAGLKAPFFTDTERMLAEIRPDAAVICTPAFVNLSVARPCLEKGLDVFVEKPLAHTFEAAKTMVALAGRSHAVNATGYLMAHMTIFQKAKSLISEGVLGRLERVRASVYTSEVFAKKKGWLYDPDKAGGGAVISIASHLLYLLYWYFGQAREAFAQTKAIYSDVEDAATALLLFDGGLHGTMDVSWSLPGFRLPHTEIHVEGDNGTMEVTGDYVKLYLFRGHKSYPREWTTIHKIDLPSPGRFIIGAEGLYEEDQDFVSRCLDRGRPAVSWSDGLEVQRMIEAIYRSAAQKKVISTGDLV
jgi:predicted dehydrogenase